MYTLGQLAKTVSGRVEGNPDIVIRGVAPVAEADEGHITFATDDNTLAQAASSNAAGVIVPLDASGIDKPVIRVPRPRVAFARILELFAPPIQGPEGVATTAFIAADAQIGPGTVVGDYAHVGPGSRIGENVVIYPGVYVGAEVEIGGGTVLYPGVIVMDRVHIGSRVVLHPGVVIGSDGFGYVPVDGRHRKVPQIGTVHIGDDVEIGVQSAVARATMGTTRIGRGTKIDGHVYVAHNVQLGDDVIIAGMSALAGSAVVEDGVTLAGQTGVVGHLTVGKGAIVGARGLVTNDVAPGQFVSGNPARNHRETMRTLASQRRVPELLKTVARLERRVAQLEEQRRQSGADGP